MNKRSIQKKMILACIIFLWFVGPIHASQDQALAIFPFSLQADQPSEALKSSLPLMLKESLEKEGVRVVFVKDIADPAALENWNHEKFRQQGIRLGVDRILTGHIFISGQRISIDAAIQSIYEDRPPLTVFSQAESLGGLVAAVKSLNRSIIAELFEKRIISVISVTGNHRVEADAITRVIQARKGDIADPDKLSKDLRLIYKMGYFDDVAIEKKTLDRGLEIIFKVKEKPSVRKIKFSKNHVYEDAELLDVVETTTGSILNRYKINSDVERLKGLYTDKNYHNCKIEYKIKNLENNQADVQFTIDEGDKLRIGSISFDGNKFFDKEDLLDKMETSEEGFWSFISSSGDLDETELDNDVIRIQSFYKNNGFIDVKVSDPEIEFKEKSIAVRFKIDEGEQYKTGRVKIQGDILTTREKLLNGIETKQGELYNRELIRKDLIKLTDIYSDRGYANVNVIPVIKKREQEKIVDISFKIQQGDLVYFNRIIITGNSKTRDKVIRRELAVQEQGLFSKSGIQRSYRNLNFKDYFQTVEVTPVKTDRPNFRDVEVKVEEKSTGNISFGGGFSSDDGAFGQISVEERNLFGKGQTGKVMTKLSDSTLLFLLGYTEPWLFDMPISAGIDLYKLEKEYDYYDKDSLGMTLRTGFRQFFDYTTMGVEYNIEKFDISNVETANTSVMAGSYLTSSLTPYIKYDSRNHSFLPTRGKVYKFSVEYAGELLGGEINYTRFLLETGCWLPTFWKFTLALHAEAGYLDDRTDGDIDIDWERFYLGGINSIRGFDNTDINGTRGDETVERGGEKYLQFNVELIFPIQEQMGVAGVFFYDRGDVYRTSEDFDLGDQYSSAGFEVRWNSPMGPIRLAYGMVVEGKGKFSTGDGQFDFSVGAFF